jgi:hypothetical protein
VAIVDYIVIGSGCTGAIAAQTLVEAGVQVLMLDGGVTDRDYAGAIPDKDYLDIRKHEKNQHEYFIGKNFEGIPFGNVKTGEHLTPPRKFMLHKVQDWMPMISDSFFPLESLSLGGLGNGWGLGCCMFSKAELNRAGLDAAKMSEAYEWAGKRIGISGSNDDAGKYTSGGLSELMPPMEMDSTGKNLYQNYQRKKNKLNKNGFFMGRTSLALLTQDKSNRKAYRYKDLDFYCDQDKSAYRPSFTVEDLKQKNNFTYHGGLVVLKFEEGPDSIKIECRSQINNESVFFECRKLVMATSCLSTARIVLRSYNAYDFQLPIISNPYSYLPAIQPYMLGRDNDQHKVGFAQLSLFYDHDNTNTDVAMSSIYSYRSLMAFHILKETPMGTKHGFEFLQYMMPAFTIAGLFHPEHGGNSKYLQLKKDADRLTGDALHINYKLTDAESHKVAHNEHKFTQALRTLNCFVLKKMNPGHGSGIHYAGTLPFSDKNEKFKILPTGKLGATNNVFVADGSGFTYLPAKGLTFSLMANAHNVALNALQG